MDPSQPATPPNGDLPPQPIPQIDPLQQQPPPQAPMQSIYPATDTAPQPAGASIAAPADDEQKDYVVAFLLSWLLGGVGADRFYLGYTKSAIVKLITFGGLGIWVVIDVWRLAFGKLKDKSGIPLKGYDKNKSWTKALAVIHLLLLVLVVGLITFSLVIATKSGVQQTARDAERKTDINALQGSLEQYKASHGQYPSLAQINSASFRQTNFVNVGQDVYKDPRGSSDQLSDSGGINQYSYAPAPTDCTGQDTNKCLTYSLNATLEAGGYYTKYSEN